MGKHSHWLLLKKHRIPTGNKWYSHVPNVVTETEDVWQSNNLLDKAIKTDRKVNHNRPDMIVIDREEHIWYIVDFTIPMDLHVNPILVEGGVIYPPPLIWFSLNNLETVKVVILPFCSIQ